MQENKNFYTVVKASLAGVIQYIEVNPEIIGDNKYIQYIQALKKARPPGEQNKNIDRYFVTSTEFGHYDAKTNEVQILFNSTNQENILLSNFNDFCKQISTAGKVPILIDIYKTNQIYAFINKSVTLNRYDSVSEAMQRGQYQHIMTGANNKPDIIYRCDTLELAKKQADTMVQSRVAPWVAVECNLNNEVVAFANSRTGARIDIESQDTSAKQEDPNEKGTKAKAINQPETNPTKSVYTAEKQPSAILEEGKRNNDTAEIQQSNTEKISDTHLPLNSPKVDQKEQQNLSSTAVATSLQEYSKHLKANFADKKNNETLLDEIAAACQTMQYSQEDTRIDLIKSIIAEKASHLTNKKQHAMLKYIVVQELIQSLESGTGNEFFELYYTSNKKDINYKSLIEEDRSGPAKQALHWIAKFFGWKTQGKELTNQLADSSFFKDRPQKLQNNAPSPAITPPNTKL